MNTLNSPAAPVAPGGRPEPGGRAGRPGRLLRRAAVYAASPLAVGALLAGCASADSTGSNASSVSHATTSQQDATPASGGSASSEPGSGAAATATPVPTVSGGPYVPGQPACAGWPSGATSVSLPLSFAVLSVERCVTTEQAIPGKGLWTTATLQRADSGLGALISALREPNATRQPGTLCPELAIIPPQILLIGANGQKLVPRLPVTGCGLIQSRVLAALNTLHWQPVSVRLIAKVPSGTGPTVSGSAPHSIETVGPAN